MRCHAGEGRLNRLARLNAFRERWRDPSLTALLVVQCATIFGAAPASAAGLALPPAFGLLLLVLFMSLVILMARGRWTLVFGASTLAVAGLSAAVQGRYPTREGALAGDVIAIITIAVVGLIVFHAAFGPGRFTAHRIRGAIVLYLNIGLVFAILHRLVAELLPGAYDHLPSAADVPAFRAAIDYFSFATLSSLGYGDIVPVHPVARSMATLEACIGQLYPPTLLARVVMLEIAHSRGE